MYICISYYEPYSWREKIEIVDNKLRIPSNDLLI